MVATDSSKALKRRCSHELDLDGARGLPSTKKRDVAVHGAQAHQQLKAENGQNRAREAPPATRDNRSMAVWRLPVHSAKVLSVTGLVFAVEASDDTVPKAGQ